MSETVTMTPSLWTRMSNPGHFMRWSGKAVPWLTALSLAALRPHVGRGERTALRIGEGEAFLVDESYNANPASMRATLGQLGRTPARRRVAVLGAMKELGSHGPDFHAALAAPLRDAGVDYAVLVGPEMAPLADELGKAVPNALGKPLAFAHADGVQQAIATLRAFGLERDDAILVKGSNSVGLASLVAALSKREG